MSAKNLIYPTEVIASRVAALGTLIKEDYGKLLAADESLLVVGVLNGAFIFMADLTRAIGDFPLEIDFVRLSSYQNDCVSSNEIIITKDLEKNIKGRHVLIVEDIADCGLTLAWLLEHLQKREPASLKVAVAVDKKARRATEIPLDYVAFSVEDGFLVGYGLDYAENYRALPAIYEITTR